jgi:hypothetical protein
MPQGGEKPAPASSLTNFKSIGYQKCRGVFQFARAIISAHAHSGPFGTLTQASYPKLGVAIENLHTPRLA